MKSLQTSTVAIGLSAIALTCSPSSWAQSEAPTLQMTAQALATTGTTNSTTATATATTNSKLPPTFSWMSPEVSQAWNQGFQGQGATMTIVDDFVSRRRSSGNMGLGALTMRHGEWTAYEAALVAPMANINTHDVYAGKAIALAPNKLNIINASYAVNHSWVYASQNIYWNPQEKSMIAYAKNGQAVVAKAAGNDGIAIGTPDPYRSVDGLSVLLKGAKSAILVGALWRNGTARDKAELAWYSNKPGNDTVYQNMFLTVGVESNKTGLAGTSFAAPIVSGYAAILGSKFRTATPTAIVSQLLTTARKDTIRMYDPTLHGRGEASLSRALAPATIR